LILVRPGRRTAQGEVSGTAGSESGPAHANFLLESDGRNHGILQRAHVVPNRCHTPFRVTGLLPVKRIRGFGQLEKLRNRLSSRHIEPSACSRVRCPLRPSQQS
jgi:hypothetical protein